MQRRRAGQAKFLAQGTLYPDVIESVPIDGNPAALIKSHHNVGGLPEKMKFALVEPLKCLFKDEVRQLGTRTRFAEGNCFAPAVSRTGAGRAHSRRSDAGTLRDFADADAIVVEEMKANGLYYKIWQSFAVLLPVRSVGVMGDERTYDYTIAIRAVESQDGMTADWVKLPYALLEKLASASSTRCKGVNRWSLTSPASRRGRLSGNDSVRFFSGLRGGAGLI